MRFKIENYQKARSSFLFHLFLSKKMQGVFASLHFLQRCIFTYLRCTVYRNDIWWGSWKDCWVHTSTWYGWIHDQWKGSWLVNITTTLLGNSNTTSTLSWTWGNANYGFKKYKRFCTFLSEMETREILIVTFTVCNSKLFFTFLLGRCSSLWRSSCFFSQK